MKKWEKFFENMDCERCQYKERCVVNKATSLLGDIQQRMKITKENFETALCFEMKTTCIKEKED